MAPSRKIIGGEIFVTDVPARLERLPWGRFHWLVVTALGVTWILDGLEVTLVGSLAPAISGAHGLQLSAREVGLAGSAYILGAVLGAIVFGRLTDRWGRRRLFTLTREDSRIGFEPSCQYFYLPLDLVEKVINCRWLLEHLEMNEG